MQTTDNAAMTWKGWAFLFLPAIVGLLAYVGSPVGPTPAEAATTLTVTTTDDVDTGSSGDGCSLRDAFEFANGTESDDDCNPSDDGGPYTIQLTAGQTYTLTLGSPDDSDASSGDLDVGDFVTVIIEVSGGGTATVEQTIGDRAFDVLEGASLTLTDVIVQGGDVTGTGNPRGGGIFVEEGGRLTLTNSVVRDNEASEAGGGIYNNGGTAQLNNATVTGNFVVGDFSLGGGGIFNEGTLSLDGSTVSLNRVEDLEDDGDGGGIYNDFNSTATLSNSTVSSNFASDDAGGIQNFQGTLTIIGSVISDNEALEDGGGIDNEGFASLTDTLVAGNTAEDGGGIYNDFGDELVIFRSTIHDNHVTGEGGGIDIQSDGSVTLTESTVSANTAGESGGGIANEAVLVLRNSTVSGNRATEFGGGIYNDVEEEGVGETTLTNVTVAFNEAGSGGGLYEEFPFEVVNETFSLTNTIVAENSPDDCAGDETGFESSGNNLDSDGSCITDGVNNDITGTASLSALTVNAPGTTATHALMAGSQAIDAGNDGVCGAAPINGVDQRGVERPQDGDGDGVAVCDIGAYELAPSGLTVIKVCVGTGFEATFEVAVAEFTAPIACGGTVATPGLAPGEHTLRETISGPDEGAFSTAIACEGSDPVAAPSTPVTIPGGSAEPVICVVINVFDADGVSDGEDGEDGPLAMIRFLPIDLEIDNDNTNVIGIDNDNTNNNANDNDNANENENTNANDNDNTNTNTQDQDNEQGQDNENDQTNNIDASPEVNIRGD